MGNSIENEIHRIKTEIASIDKTRIDKVINNIKERMIKNVR